MTDNVYAIRRKAPVRTTGKGTKPRFFVAALLRMTKLRPRPRARGHTERKLLRSIPGGERPWICRPERSEGPEFRSSESKPRSFRRKARRQDDKQGANPFARDGGCHPERSEGSRFRSAIPNNCRVRTEPRSFGRKNSPQDDNSPGRRPQDDRQRHPRRGGISPLVSPRFFSRLYAILF